MSFVFYQVEGMRVESAAAFTALCRNGHYVSDHFLPISLGSHNLCVITGLPFFAFLSTPEPSFSLHNQVKWLGLWLGYYTESVIIRIMQKEMWC